MADYTISENFILPSNGLIYDPPVAPEITLRSMTTAEEMRRLSVSEYQYKPMSDILDACIVDGPKMSAYDMCLGDYQFLLYKLRIVTYGDEYKIESKCPYCGFTNSDTISLDIFPIMGIDNIDDSVKEFDLSITKKHIKLRYQTPRILDTINYKSKEAKKKSEDKSIDFSILYNLMYMIDTIDGQKYDVGKMEKWLRELPMRDSNLIFNKARKFNDAIGLDTDIEVGCSLCGLTYKYPFRPGATFFRPELDV